MLGPTRCRATLRPCARPRDGPRLTVAAPRSQAYSEDWMLRCFSEHVDKRQQNILYADNLGGRPPARPSAPSRDLPFVLQEVHDLFIELLQSVPRSLIDFHVELDMLLQPPLLERPIISAPPGAPWRPPAAPHAHARARSDTAPDERLRLLRLRMGVRELPAVEFRQRVRHRPIHVYHPQSVPIRSYMNMYCITIISCRLAGAQTKFSRLVLPFRRPTTTHPLSAERLPSPTQLARRNH